jgi:molecular chaperone GrpE (heat shock protein)
LTIIYHIQFGLFICLHCGKEVPRNHHIKRGQKYCSAKECQRSRKREWDKDRYNSDEPYKYRRLSSQKIWRKKRPSHEYQKNYRKMHPEYVNRNRELQRNRNKKRKKSKQKDIEDMIVNTDSIAQGILTIYIYRDKKLAR